MLDISNLFLSTLYAQATPATPKAPTIFEMLVMPAALLAILYFFMILPQQRKAKELAKVIQALKAGDEVITSGGIIGRVRSVADTFVTIEVSSNASLKVLKNHISGLSKAEKASS